MSPETTLILAATVGSFLSASLLVPHARRAACRFGLTDRPRRGRIHQHAIPYLGGVAIVVAVAGSISLLPAWTMAGAAILVGGVIVGAVGLVDDVHELGPAVRVAAEAAAAGLVVAAGVGFHVVGHPVDDILTVGWLVLMTNAFNLIDNVDGAAAVVAVCTSAMLLVVAAIGGQSLVIGLAGVVGGASLGFLIYNWHPATIYMGDTGSLFLGFTLSAAVLTLRFPVHPMVGAVAAMLMVLPALFDTALVVLSRLVAGRPVHVGGTDHTSHRLMRLGVPPACVVALLGAGSIVGGALGLAVGRGTITVAPALVAVLPVVAIALALLLRVPVYEPSAASPRWERRDVVGVETPELASNVS